jgi:putative ABC transport system substrate-binding protein
MRAIDRPARQRRAALLALPLGCVSLWLAPPSTVGSQPKLPVIGFLGSGTRSASQAAFDALLDGLRELGWIEGRNFRLVARFAEGRYEQLPALAAELVRSGVDLIVALPTPATIAARQATATVPIVGISVGDPVGQGLASSLARPGGNVTGLSISFDLGIWAKQLQLLKEAVPSARRIAVLINPGNQGHVHGVGIVRSAAATLGVTMQIVEARRPEDFPNAFATIAQGRADALIVLADPMFSAEPERLATLERTHRLPTMHGTRRNIEAGGLLLYAPDLVFQVRQAAAYVDKILKGAKPGDLPFEQPTKFLLVINLKTAKALGLTLPRALLLRADELIE